MTSSACGIDFGTSNSTVGWARPGHPTLLLLEANKATLPSAIFFHDDDNEIRYGRAAIADYVAGYDGRLMRAMKSLLGSTLMDGHTEVRGRGMSFRAILTCFIAELKNRAEMAAGREFTSAVLGRPVFFVDDNPVADQLAQDTLAMIAHDVGLSNIAFQFEPLAAAFDYESRLDREELVLVVDIGGGTSDFSLIRLGPERAQRSDRREDILAHGGIHIGGTDFDKQLSLTEVMPLFGLGSKFRNGKDVPSTQYGNLACWHTINHAYTPKAAEHFAFIHGQSAEREKIARLLALIRQRAGHWVAIQVEEAKIALSNTSTACINLERIEDHLRIEVNRSAFDASVTPLVERIEKTIAELMRQAAVSASAIDTVFFTGGSSHVSSLRARVAAMVPTARNIEGDLFGSIGTGLALDARRKFD